MTKLGIRKRTAQVFNPRTEKTVTVKVKQSPLRKISPKQAEENAALSKLVNELREKAGGKSELTGAFSPHLDPHHLSGRGRNLCNPFTIIMVSRAEHMEEQKHMSYNHKQELKSLVRPIRLAQGYREEDYGSN